MRILLLGLLAAACTGCGGVSSASYDTYSFWFTGGAPKNFSGASAGDPDVVALATGLAQPMYLALGLGADYTPGQSFERYNAADGEAHGGGVNVGALSEFLDAKGVSILAPPGWGGPVVVSGGQATVTLHPPQDFSATLIPDIELTGRLDAAAVDAAVASLRGVRYGDASASAGPVAAHWTLRGSAGGAPFELSFDQDLTCHASHGDSRDPVADTD